MTDPTAHRRAAGGPGRDAPTKPLLASWMGGQEVEGGERLLNAAGIATYRYPDAAVQLFDALWRYSDNLRSLYETPALVPETEATPAGEPRPDRRGWRRCWPAPWPRAAPCSTSGKPSRCSRPTASRWCPPTWPPAPRPPRRPPRPWAIPVVVKLLSAQLTHKSDVGGVQLNLPRRHGGGARPSGACGTRSSRRHGAAAFGGVTVQPMLRPDGGLRS